MDPKTFEFLMQPTGRTAGVNSSLFLVIRYQSALVIFANDTGEFVDTIPFIESQTT